ncbi:hypothetical protein BC829DRAFT_136901 [Chytridium lagenaria]|nr:hypothetical protein BC829DRAFT_136901 [Chytridium lagenaria]
MTLFPIMSIPLFILLFSRKSTPMLTLFSQKITVNLNPHIFNPHHHDMHQPSLSSLAPRGRFREGDAWSDDERMEPMGAVAIVTTREE